MRSSLILSFPPQESGLSYMFSENSSFFYCLWYAAEIINIEKELPFGDSLTCDDCSVLIRL